MCTLTGSHNLVKGEKQEMKRTTLISASLLLAFAGCTCGQGWKPNFLTRFSNRIHGVSNVGAPCDAGCHEAAPVATGCDNCGTANSANFGGYEQVGDSYEVGVPYSTVSPAYVAPSTPAGVQNTSRMEPIRATKAN
jgi:hypothetical protein